MTRNLISAWKVPNSSSALPLGPLSVHEHGPHFTAIITENALREPIGGPEVHHKQLRRLLDVAELPNVEIRVVADRTGEWNPA